MLGKLNSNKKTFRQFKRVKDNFPSGSAYSQIIQAPLVLI